MCSDTRTEDKRVMLKAYFLKKNFAPYRCVKVELSYLYISLFLFQILSHLGLLCIMKQDSVYKMGSLCSLSGLCSSVSSIQTP